MRLCGTQSLPTRRYLSTYRTTGHFFTIFYYYCYPSFFLSTSMKSLNSTSTSTPNDSNNHCQRIDTPKSNSSTSSSPVHSSPASLENQDERSLPPSSPCSGEELRPKDKHTTKNPKMSLENLMLPFDQQVKKTQSPSPFVKQDKVIELIPTRARSAVTAKFVTPRADERHRSNIPSECATSLFANYSFGHNIAHASPLRVSATTIRSGRPLGTYFTPSAKPTQPAPSTLCAEPKAKRPWTESEDLILRGLVAKLGPGLWAAMAQQIPGRTGKQVRERWLNHLSPGVTKRPWSAEEDNVIIENHKRIGNCWSRIAKLLQGRSDNSVKNRYYTTLRRRIGNVDARTTTTSRKRYHVEDDAPQKRPRVWE